MTLTQFYETVGGDYSAVLARLGTESLVRRVLTQFLQDPGFSELETAFTAKDAETAFRAVHTLKGVCANLGFDHLYRPAFDLTEKLRGRTFDDTEDLFLSVKENYLVVMDALRQLD